MESGGVGGSRCSDSCAAIPGIRVGSILFLSMSAVREPSHL